MFPQIDPLSNANVPSRRAGFREMMEDMMRRMLTGTFLLRLAGHRLTVTHADGRPYLAMKLIKGRTLAELLHERPAGINYLAIFEAVCQAVGYAHAHRVIHRDLKPSNVMVGAFGEVSERRRQGSGGCGAGGRRRLAPVL